MRVNKFRLVSLLCTSAGLAACSMSGGNPNQAGQSPEKASIASKSVLISRLSTIPTNLGVSGSHSLKIDNHTGENLVLKGFELSGSNRASFFAKGYSALKTAMGAVGYDSRVNLAGCSTLANDSSCVITFSPDEADGSAALKLNFIDKNGNLYPAAQLLEYSSNVNKSNGFYVSNAQITNVATTNNYSLAIPFVSDDNYKSIEVVSRIITLSQGVDCAKGASKGTHCTALLTLPAADPKSGGYNNPIMIKGTKADGSVSYATLSSGTIYNDTANLAITSGPVVIDATPSSGNPSLSKTINIVNNGVSDARGVSDSSLVGDHWLDGVTIPGGSTSSLLKKEISCSSGVVTKLPTTLNAAETCSVKFTLTDANATGSEDYRVTYSGGAEGAKPTTTSTKIYFRGLDVPDYSYNLTGDINFTNVNVDSSLSTELRVENTGTKALQDISYSTLPALPAGISVDDATSTCSGYTGVKQLKAGEHCSYSLQYSPKAKASLAIFNFKVIANTTETSSTEVKPTQSLAISYSAVENNGTGLLIKRNSKGYSIFADDKNYRTSRVIIQNTGQTDFNLNQITAKGWSDKLSFTAPADATTPNSGNALDGVSSSDGTFNGDIILAAGSIAALDYTYGPTPTEESGLAEQWFIGKFNNTGTDYKVANHTYYEAKAGGINVSTEPVTSGTASGITNLSTDEYKFVLTKSNQVKVSFKYTAGAAGVDGFLVDDSSIPFGFMVDPIDTKCPTTSKADRADKIAAGGSCVVSYTYLASELNHSLFYTAAVNGPIEIIAPAYSIKDTTGIHVVTPDNKIKLTPSPFVIVTATSVKGVTTTAGDTVHTVTFKASGYANTLLPGAQVVVTPKFVAGVYPLNVGSCTITNPGTDGSCSIEIVQENGAPVIVVPFNYASTQDADFNARNSSITLGK